VGNSQFLGSQSRKYCVKGSEAHFNDFAITETRHAYEILINPESCWEYDTKGPSTSRTFTWSPPRRSTNRGLRPIRQPRFDPTDSDNDDDFMFMDEKYIERLFQEARAAHASQAGQAMNVTRLGQNIAKNRQRGGFGFSSDPECSPSGEYSEAHLPG
jgi:hypothetical protein